MLMALWNADVYIRFIQGLSCQQKELLRMCLIIFIFFALDDNRIYLENQIYRRTKILFYLFPTTALFERYACVFVLWIRNEPCNTCLVHIIAELVLLKMIHYTDKSDGKWIEVDMLNSTHRACGIWLKMGSITCLVRLHMYKQELK